MAGLLLFGAVFLVTVYRAAAQSITYDEALDHLWFADGIFASTFHSPVIIYVNLHLLYIALTKICIALFGLSDFTLRLPALGGTLVYLAALWRLRPVLFRRGDLALLAGALMTLNPFIMDFMPYARGYILALGLSLMAFHGLLTGLIRQAGGGAFRARAWVGAYTLLAVAVLTNLSFVFPALAIISTSLALVIVVTWRYGGGGFLKILGTVAAGFAIFALATAFSAWAVPYWKLFESETYYRFEHFMDSARGLMNFSFNHAGVDTWNEARCGVVLGTAANIFIPACLVWMAGAFVIVLGKIALGRRPAPQAAGDLPMLFAAGMLLAGVCGYLMSHYLFGMFYPRGRTAMFLLVFFTLAFCVTAQWHAARRHWFPVPRAFALGMAFAACAFAIQFQTRYFAIFRCNADSREAWTAISRICRAHPGDHFNMAVTWFLGAPLSFYERVDKVENLNIQYAWDPAGVFIKPAELYYTHKAPRDGVRRVLAQYPVSATWLSVHTGYRPDIQSVPDYNSRPF